ncbi:hypothetical protein [Devosia elaeis]|uniref:Uncharacterized protein n=1 Tax=Devosia elaeis TaxID=1770058 RepID=A0A178HRC5_9HYPH|nr:hypothetical protein [Devosia elaeis]OAM75217.1 hypothetical protein A3840_14825 [Devosia elaeis]
MLQFVKQAARKVPGARRVVRALRRRSAAAKPLAKKSASLVNLLSARSVTAEDIEKISGVASTYSAAWAALEYKRGNHDLAISLAETIPANAPIQDKILAKSWDSMRDLGRYDLALRGLHARRPDPVTPSFQARLDHTLFSHTAFEAFRRYVTAVEHSNPKGYVVLFDLGSRVTTGLMVPISYQLASQGYSVCSAVAGSMPKSRLPELSNISAMMRANGSGLTSGETEPQNEWAVSWDEGTVSCDGINYFTFFLERISKLARSYRGGLDTPEAQALFDDMLRRSDLAITMCKRLVPLAAQGKPVRVVTMESHFAPWGVVRRWCDTVGRDHDIHLIGMSVAYENYFSNLTSIEAKTLSIEDLTANPDLRHPFLGGRHRFTEFRANAPSPEEMRQREEQALSWIRIDRSRSDMGNGHQRQMVIDAISEARKKGRRSFCVLGKVLIDFAAPDDQGHVFDDFTSWLRMLVELSSQHDALLVIKPHPHEIREEIVQSGVQMLRELLPEHLPDNVIFLDHTTFNSSELAELVDAAFVWNGTACAEFPVLGCPVFAESVWAARDYPVDNPVLMTTGSYIDVFNGSAELKVSDANREAAIDYLHFMRSDIVAIPFRYMRRAGTNQAIGANMLYEDELTELEQRGDPYVELAASRFFEFAHREAQI